MVALKPKNRGGVGFIMNLDHHPLETIIMPNLLIAERSIADKGWRKRKGQLQI